VLEVAGPARAPGPQGLGQELHSFGGDASQMGQREQSKDDAGGENVGSHGRESWVGDRGRERRRQAPAFGPDVRLASKPGASNTHAAYPSTRSPPLSGE